MARAFVCGCLGPVLSASERSFLKEADPLGLILFRRNIETPAAVTRLCAEIRDALGRDAMILVDQEGGRVQRLGPPHWKRYPAAARFATAYRDLDERIAAVRRVARLMAMELRDSGITVDCMPVLDVPVAGSHDVIGDRAYGGDPASVARLGRAAAEGLLDGGVLPIMKHVPGHGRAQADSHLALPVVDAAREALMASDFLTFRSNADLPAAMTAHVTYNALDPDHPATISRRVIQDVVRGAIGFDGLLFSDDLSMKALPGTMAEKATALFAAGVDIALHCNGEPDEAQAVAAAAPLIEGPTAQRVARALACIDGREPLSDRAFGRGQAFDPVDADAERERVLAATA